MITTRKPNDGELAALVSYLLEKRMDWAFGEPGSKAEAKVWERSAWQRVTNARCIIVFEPYPFTFTQYPQYRKLYDDKLIFVIWDNDPDHSQAFLHAKSGMKAILGDGML